MSAGNWIILASIIVCWGYIVIIYDNNKSKDRDFRAMWDKIDRIENVLNNISEDIDALKHKNNSDGYSVIIEKQNITNNGIKQVLEEIRKTRDEIESKWIISLKK